MNKFDFIKALPARRKITELIIKTLYVNGPTTYGRLCEILEKNPSNLSQSIKLLMAKELGTKKGKKQNAIYELNMEVIKKFNEKKIKEIRKEKGIMIK